MDVLGDAGTARVVQTDRGLIQEDAGIKNQGARDLGSAARPSIEVMCDLSRALLHVESLERRLLENHADLGKRRATAAGYDAGRLSPEVR